MLASEYSSASGSCGISTAYLECLFLSQLLLSSPWSYHKASGISLLWRASNQRPDPGSLMRLWTHFLHTLKAGRVLPFLWLVFCSFKPLCLVSCCRCLQRPSVDLSLCELFFYGLFAGFAVWEVEAEVRPLIGPTAIRDSDGVAHTKMHCLHDALSLQLARATDGDGGGIAAGADELLGPIIVTLLEFLKASPDNHPVLLWDLQCSEILEHQQQ